MSKKTPNIILRFATLAILIFCPNLYANSKDFWEKTNSFLLRSNVYDQAKITKAYKAVFDSESYRDYQGIRYDSKTYIKLINKVVNTPLHKKLAPPDKRFLDTAAKVHTTHADTFKKYYTLLIYTLFEDICLRDSYGKWITATGVSIEGAFCPLGKDLFARDKKGYFNLHQYPLEQIESLFRSMIKIYSLERPNFGQMAEVANGVYSFLATDGFKRLNICLYDLIRALVPAKKTEVSKDLYIIHSSEDLLRRFRVPQNRHLDFLKSINQFFVHLGVGEFTFDESRDQFKWKLTGGLHTFSGIELFALFEITRGRRVFKKEVSRSELKKFDSSRVEENGLRILIETPKRRNKRNTLRHVKLSKGFFTGSAYRKLRPRGYKTLFSLDFSSHNAFNVCLAAFQRFLNQTPALQDTIKPQMHTIAVDVSTELNLENQFFMDLEIGFEVKEGLMLPRTCYPNDRLYPKPS